MNARYYVPNTNRMLTPDTIVPDPTNPQAFNRYSYVENNPINFNDPSGHCKNGRGQGPDSCQVVGAGQCDHCPSYHVEDKAFWLDDEARERLYGESYDAIDNFYKQVAIGGSLFFGGAYAAPLVESAGTFIATHTTTAAAIEGGVETAIECAMTGGGCGPGDFAAGIVTGGLAHRISTPPPHGNSKTSMRPQHGYEIYEIETGNVVKTGISGQRLNKNGTSPRANTQVNAFNRDAGETIFAANLKVQDMPGRQTALNWERVNAQQLWDNGNSMKFHKRPRPWE